MSWIRASLSSSVNHFGNWVSTAPSNIYEGVKGQCSHALTRSATSIATVRAFATTHGNHIRLGAYSAMALGTWYMSGDGSYLTYLAPSVITATTDAYWNRHTVQQVGAKQLTQAQQHLACTSTGVVTAYKKARDSDFVEQNRGYLTTAGYVATTLASWCLDGGWSSAFTTLAIGTVGVIRNSRNIYQTTFGQPNAETQAFIRDLELFQDTSTETIQPIPHDVVVRVHDKLKNFLASPLPLTGHEYWIHTENKQVLEAFAQQLHLGIGLNTSLGPICISNETRTQLRQVLKYVIECEQAQIGYFSGPSLHTTASITTHQNYLREFTNKTRTYTTESLEHTIEILEELIKDPSPLLGAVSISRQLMGSIPWKNLRYQRQYQLLVTHLRNFLHENKDTKHPLGLPSYICNTFAEAVNICDEIQTSQQSWLYQGLTYGVSNMSEPVQRVINATFNTSAATNKLDEPQTTALLTLHYLITSRPRPFTLEDCYQSISSLDREYPGIGISISTGMAQRSCQEASDHLRDTFSDIVTDSLHQYVGDLAKESKDRYDICSQHLPNVVRPHSAFSEMPLQWQAASQYIIEQRLTHSKTADESPGICANLSSILFSTEGTLIDRIYKMLTDLPDQLASGSSDLLLSGLHSVLSSQRLSQWIDNQKASTPQEKTNLKKDISEMAAFLYRVQHNPIKTVQELGDSMLAELGENNPKGITTNTQAIRLAINYLRKKFDNNVLLIHGYAVPFLNTTQPANDLIAIQSTIHQDLNKLNLSAKAPNTPESRANQSIVLDQELNVQKETFIRHATAFSAFQLVELTIGARKHREVLDAEIQEELKQRSMLKDTPGYAKALESLRDDRHYYRTPNLFKDLMQEIQDVPHKDQLSEFQCRYKKYISERVDLNWFQKKYAKVFLSFSMWGFNLILKNSMTKLTDFAYNWMHEGNGAVQIDITPIQGLKNFLIGMHRGHAQWLSDTTDAKTDPQNPLLDKDQYMDHILRGKAYNQNYTADELNLRFGDILVNHCLPDLNWSNKINETWTKGLWSWCTTNPVDSSSFWSIINRPLKCLKWTLTLPLHAALGMAYLSTRVLQGIVGAALKYGTKKTLRNTNFISNILLSSRGSLYEHSPYNIAINELVLEQLKELYTALRTPSDNTPDTKRVRLAPLSTTQLNEVMGFLDNLFELQRTMNCHTPSELRDHLQNNPGFLEQLTTGLRQKSRQCYEPQVKATLAATLMAFYESCLQPNQIKKQLTAILKLAGEAMTDKIPIEQREKVSVYGAKVEAEIKSLRDNILRAIIDQSVSENIAKLGQSEVQLATALEHWMKDALVSTNSLEPPPLIAKCKQTLQQYQSGTTDLEKTEALNSIQQALIQYNGTLQQKLIEARTQKINTQTMNLLQQRSSDITARIRLIVDAFINLYNLHCKIKKDRTTTQSLQSIVNDFTQIRQDIANILSDSQSCTITLQKILSQVNVIKEQLDLVANSDLAHSKVKPPFLNSIRTDLNNITLQIEELIWDNRTLERIQKTELNAFIVIKRSSYPQNIFTPMPRIYTQIRDTLNSSIRSLHCKELQTALLTEALAIHHTCDTHQIIQLRNKVLSLIQKNLLQQQIKTQQVVRAFDLTINKRLPELTSHLITPTTEEENPLINTISNLCDELSDHITNAKSPTITFSNINLLPPDSAIPKGIAAWIFSEMQKSTNNLLLMSQKGYLFEGVLRHAVILPVVNPANSSRL